MGYEGFQTYVINYMRDHLDIDWKSPDSNQILQNEFMGHELLAGKDDKTKKKQIRVAKSTGIKQLGLNEQDDSVDVLGLSDGSLDAESAANELDLSDDGLSDPELTPGEVEQAVMVNGSARRKPAEYLTIDGKIENPPPREKETPAPRETKKRKSPGRPVLMTGEIVKYGFQLEKSLLKEFKKTLIDREETGSEVIRRWIQAYVEGNR